MTRQLGVVERFERGTLLEVTPAPEYANVGTAHAYYVPDRAREEAGMELVQERESAAEFRTEDGGFDWQAITELVSARDLVERVEESTLNQTDGAVGNTTPSRTPGFSWRRSGSDRMTIPVGVVKFGDPERESDDAPYRDPIERGYCWAAIQDRIAEDSANKRVQYQDDVQREHVLRARVPMGVVRTGDAAVAAYLAAHDHSDRYIGYALERDPEQIPSLLADLTSSQ